LATNSRLTKNWIAFLLVSLSSYAVAHEEVPKKDVPLTPELKTALEEINERYVKDVKVIFQNKCFDCHSSQTQFPWYQKIPVIKQWIQKDIDEAKEHLDMELNFPFKSHASPLEDLEAIDKTVAKNEMPPLRYRMTHAGSALTAEEKEIVHQWIQFGKKLLKQQ